jgi:predicted nucleic acid-binding Zn ribbon protein
MGGSSRRQTGGSAPLSLLLEGVMGDLDLGTKLKERLALRAWAQVAGRVVGAHTRAEAVRDGILIVATDTPAWAQELQMRREELLGRLETAVGKGVIADVHFRSGFRPRRNESRTAQTRPADVALSERQTREISRASARIEAPELRAKAQRAFSSLTRIAEWRKESGWRRCGRCGHWQRTGKRWCASCLHTRKKHE